MECSICRENQLILLIFSQRTQCKWHFYILEMMISAARYGNCSSAEGRKTMWYKENSLKRQNIKRKYIIYIFSFIILHFSYHQDTRVNQTQIKTTVICSKQHYETTYFPEATRQDYNLRQIRSCLEGIKRF